VECADPEYQGNMRWLANTETTFLAAFAQQMLNEAKVMRMVKYGIGISGTAIGAVSLLGVV